MSRTPMFNLLKKELRYYLKWKITIAVKANLKFPRVNILVLTVYSINLDKLSLAPVFNQFMNCMSYSSTEKHKSLTSVGVHCSLIIILTSCSCQFSFNEALLNGKGGKFHKILFFWLSFWKMIGEKLRKKI